MRAHLTYKEADMAPIWWPDLITSAESTSEFIARNGMEPVWEAHKVVAGHEMHVWATRLDPCKRQVQVYYSVIRVEDPRTLGTGYLGSFQSLKAAKERWQVFVRGLE